MMRTLKVSTRLALLTGILATLLVGVGVLGLAGIDRSNAALKSVYEDRTVAAGQIAEIERRILENRLAIASALLTPTPQAVERHAATVAMNIERINGIWKAYMARSLAPGEAERAAAFAADRKRFVQEGLQPTAAALREGRLDAAATLAVERVAALHPPVSAGIQALQTIQLDAARAAYDAAAARYATTRTLTLAAIGGGLLFALLSGVFMTRGLMRELGAEPATAAALARAVAQGDLSVAIALAEGDRGSLMAQLRTMQASLCGIVERVRSGSEGVATASTQIAQGNQDLSGRTEQQASQLEQTASSMQQLAATVQQNADDAREADTLAIGARDVALRGGEVVGAVVDTMRGINDSSRRIAEIIGVIDAIAFQTNILALNAAVEAARAGESGRGFAVVAAEVRALAQRSAGAAREIKDLIGASVERVDAGTALVDQAGATMQEIVQAIGRVTDIVARIRTASAEQSSGVARIGEAVVHMDRATQQNAALVEQSAAAAQCLSDQARQLVHAVAVFRLGAAASPA